MSAQFENSFSSYTSQFASAAVRANQLALEHAESAFGLQLKAFEQNASATASFLGEIAQVRDLDSYQTLWPKGLQLARDSMERLASTGQEMVGLSWKASEAIGQLARQQFNAGSAQASGKTQRK
ncbi:phasin family protein [Xanthomonas maliensis]|uniref:phasin family protein n=1 Tax=Xanthomonas maliensis TaxID=1321368 RepID=UPI0003A70265|nr:phasin family protein [Xanthomonas maliensis]KAB7765839.1 phasin-family protein [Xanthomonas maliensis]